MTPVKSCEILVSKLSVLTDLFSLLRLQQQIDVKHTLLFILQAHCKYIFSFNIEHKNRNDDIFSKADNFLFSIRNGRIEHRFRIVLVTKNLLLVSAFVIFPSVDRDFGGLGYIFGGSPFVSESETLHFRPCVETLDYAFD